MPLAQQACARIGASVGKGGKIERDHLKPVEVGKDVLQRIVRRHRDADLVVVETVAAAQDPPASARRRPAPARTRADPRRRPGVANGPKRSPRGSRWLCFPGFLGFLGFPSFSVLPKARGPSRRCGRYGCRIPSCRCRAQRPARASSPSVTGLVHRRAADREVALARQGMAGQFVDDPIGLDLGEVPLGQRIDLQPRALAFHQRHRGALRRLVAPASVDPDVEAGERGLQRFVLADRAAQVGIGAGSGRRPDRARRAAPDRARSSARR